MSEPRDHAGRGSSGHAARGSAAPEKPEPRNVLTQRVVALNGDLDSSQSGTRSRTVTRRVDAQVSPPSRVAVDLTNPEEPVDLSITALEWGAKRPESPPREVRDAEWATHSSISIELCEELLVSQRVLRSSIEDAVTKQYRATPPALTSASTSDLASLDRVLEAAGEPDTYESGLVTRVREAAVPTAPSAPAPRVLVVPAWVAWTVLGLFALCVGLLAHLVVRYLL
jgi:hypothetical protein